MLAIHRCSVAPVPPAKRLDSRGIPGIQWAGVVRKTSNRKRLKAQPFTRTPTEPLIDRGFTFHEHLYPFTLINMNGRAYDPLVGRFLSTDPYIQAPDNTQNLNRYSYCLNNPLRYSDPSGEFIFSAFLPGIGIFLDAACYGALIGGGGYVASVAFSSGGFNNWNWGEFGKAAGFGALSGVITSGIGSWYGNVGSNGVMGEVERAVAHGFAQGTISEFNNGDFANGFLTGGFGSAGGSAYMMYGGEFAESIGGMIGFSSVSSGIASAVSGGNFWRGAATGATIGLLNHASSDVEYFTHKNLGTFVLSREEGINFIYHNAPKENVEIGMVECTESESGVTRYFIPPWDQNNNETCIFDKSRFPELVQKAKMLYNYHRHLSENAPSFDDYATNCVFDFSYNRNEYNKAFVITNSSVYRINRSNGPVALRGLPTGFRISDIQSWLNGNFNGL